jgi:hypothetical protein
MPLHGRPDMAHLKRAARALQRAAREGQSKALARVRAIFPGAGQASIKLSQAQTVLAREQGFASWPGLARHVATLAARPGRSAPEEADAAQLAEAWFALAEAGDIPALMRAMQTAKKPKLAARGLMQAQAARYAAFVDALIGALSDGNPRVRFECAHALDTFGDSRCAAPLAALMNDPAPRVRWMAMHALTCHDCSEATCANDPALHERIAWHAEADGSIKVRRHAAIALGFTRTPFAAQTLRALLESQPDPKFQAMARWALRYCETGKH